MNYKYSPQFIAKVKRLYPFSSEIHRHVDNGNEILGRYLDDSSSGGIDPDKILSIHHIDAIHALARERKEKIALYAEWYNEINKNS